ncbi:MAG: iron-containing alcohol dehydrogenase [Coprothermobacterota bacterium]|nr:iron-containing alcohol dehydrogenase [Coprothermobacterota bacterium]
MTTPRCVWAGAHWQDTLPGAIKLLGRRFGLVIDRPALESSGAWARVQAILEEGEGKSQARERMHYATNLAGMAINNASADLAHALDQVGSRFKLPHGMVCAILSPHTLAAAGATPICPELAEGLGLKGRTPAVKRFCLAERVRRLVQEVGLP